MVRGAKQGKRGKKLKKAFGYKVEELETSTESPSTDEDSDSGSQLEVDTSSSSGREQVIEWNLPQSSIPYGTQLSGAYLNAKVVKGNGQLTYSVKKGTVLDVGKTTLRVDAAATKQFDAAFKTVEIEVKPKITWEAPKTSMTYGEKLSSTQLNATVEPKGLTLVYTPPLNTVLDAGKQQTLRVTAQVGDNLNAASKEVRIDVNKAPTIITWSDPKPVKKDALLSDTQLNAKSNRAGALVYTPAKNTKLSDVKTYWLMVTQEATSNYLSAVRQVRLMVGASQNALNGFNGVNNGSKWYQGNLTPQAQQVLNNWNADTDGMKTQGQKIMKDLSGKTAEELIDYMNKLVPKKEDRKSTGGDYPNEIWKLPNGLQVRYKSKGDKRNVGVPMFCIEGRTTAGFSSGQTDIAFKVSSTGVPTAKGSKDTQKSNLNSTEDERYLNGACKATHLYCEPKLTPVIEWTPPAEMDVTANFSNTELCAVLKFGDNSLTYEPNSTEKPKNVQANLKLKVTAAKTKRFNQATEEVTINVVKTKDTIFWGPLEDMNYGESLGPKQFNATTRKGGKVKYKPGGGKPKVGDNQELKAYIEEDREYEAVEKIVKINVKKADPEIKWNDQTIEYGTPLSEKQLCASQRGDGALTYEPPLDTELEVGDGQVLTVSSAETESYKASTQKVKINVKPADPNLEVSMGKTAIPYGTKLSEVTIEVEQDGDGALTYNPPLDKVLDVNNRYTLKVTSAATKNYKTATATCSFKVVQADHVIDWPTPSPIVYGTELSTDQLNASCLTCDALTYKPPLKTVLDAGLKQVLTVTVKGDKNYKGKTVTVNIDVKPAKYKIEWTPEPIDVGQPLGDKQLNAKCTPAQELDYSLDAGHVFLTAGKHSITVTAAGNGNYEETTQDVELTVNPATPTIQWNPAELTYGTPLSSDQLNATSNSDGKPTYSPPLSSIVPAGPQTLRVTFAATKNYLEATKEVTINVKRAETAIEWWEPEDELSITYGTPLSDVQLNATKKGILSSTGILSDPGELKYTPGPGTVLSAGLGQKLRVESPATANFEAAIKEIEIDVLPLLPAIDWGNPLDMQEGDPLTTDQLNAKCENGGSLVYTPPLGTVLPVGDGQSLQVTVEATANTMQATKTVKVNVKPAN